MSAENKTSSDALMMPDHFLLLKQRVKAVFLAALVPDGSEAVMVLKDGRVVGLEKVVAKYCEPVPHELPDEVYEGAILQSWLDAARQVAEEEA